MLGVAQQHIYGNFCVSGTNKTYAGLRVKCPMLR
jgi:hypothetical protein